MESHSAKNYDRLAGVYNKHLSHFPRRLLGPLEQLLLNELPPGARILDLCCGTGQLADLLCQMNFRVVGLDHSQGMLQIAAKNAPSAELVHADARKFTLPDRVDAVVSTFDSMNHLITFDDLTRALQRVSKVLHPGGRIVFDLNMEPAFATHWQKCIRFRYGSETCEILSSWDAGTSLGCNQATFYQGSRQSESLSFFERCYSEPDVALALKKAGLRVISKYDVQDDLGIDHEFGRKLFIAEK